MTEKQCYNCDYYQFDFIGEYRDEWCSKDNEYFMGCENCPNWKEVMWG